MNLFKSTLLYFQFT